MMKEDWINVEVNLLGDVITGGTPSKSNPEYYSDNDYPFYKPTDLNKGYIVKKSKDFLSELGFQNSRSAIAGAVLVTCIGATIGKTGLIKKQGAFNQQINAISPNKYILSEYLYFQIVAPTFQEEIKKNASSTTLPILNKSKFSKLSFLIAPLPEQRAIVAKIEELFSDLDKGIADLKKAQDQLVIFRQAVLKKAFEGEYSKEDYHVVKIDSLCEVVRGGSPRPAGSDKFYNGDIPFLKVKDISRNNGAYVNQAEYSIKEAGLKKTRLVKPKTLLLTNSGATLGIPAITTIETTFNDGIAAFLNLDDDLLYHYYYWCSKTKFLRNLNQGAAQPNLNTAIIGGMDIPIYCDKKEHSKIVREIESRLSVCDKVEQSITESLEKSKALRQSILKKAFEGSLLSKEEISKCKQAPDYEPASVLLEKIKVEKKKKYNDRFNNNIKNLEPC